MIINYVDIKTVAKIHGHSKASFTLDRYGHSLPGMQSRAAEVMDEIVTPTQVDLPNKEVKVFR